MNRLKWIAALAGLAALPGLAFAQAGPGPGGFGYGPGMMWWDDGWTTMFLGPFFMILALAVIVMVAVAVLRSAGTFSHGTAHPPQRTALDILKERFARGEMDAAEFESRRRLLGE
ncbi:SHOCT domain-containing protein [Acidiphilium sp. C61]|jgi:putative membrane protein|uniref:SHOCT domain-containing protein n=1 Tax=Acidiphilium sp. C61 TaxID=1671485 RepID=UPI00157B54DE|nr:SHOCT domain-containing protein [Acidiphilium sp. C61]